MAKQQQKLGAGKEKLLFNFIWPNIAIVIPFLIDSVRCCHLLAKVCAANYSSPFEGLSGLAHLNVSVTKSVLGRVRNNIHKVLYTRCTL